MSFSHPIAWGLFLLAIPIILFYILKLRLRRESVSTTIFWQQVFEERRSRSFWRRLRHLVSLLLSLIFLSLLALAVLGPIPDSQKRSARCVVIVDNSAGMNARSGDRSGTSRLEQAKTELLRFLTTTELARQTAILTAGGQPQIAVGFTDHLGTLRQGVETIPATDRPTSLGETISLARQLLATEADSTILVYTDGCTTDLTELERLPNVRFFPVGRPVDNLAITRFQPRRALGDAIGYEILVETTNFGRTSRKARLEIELEGRVVDVVPLTLESHESKTSIIRDATPGGGLLRATLISTDEGFTDPLSTDDTAVAFLPARPTQSVYFYGEDDFFLLKVLQSQPNTALFALADIPATIPEGGVLILHRTVPDTIPGGNVFIVDPQNGCDLFDVGSPLESPLVAREEKDSPLMTFVHLTHLLIPGARIIKPKADGETKMPGWRFLAETPDESPIYLQFESPGRNVVVLTADLKRGDLALRTAFPIMISQALMQFRGSGGELEKAWSTADSIHLDLKTTNPAAEHVVLKSPSGAMTPYPLRSGKLSLPPLSECGVWEILESRADPTTETVLKRIACNLVHAAESDLRSAPESFYEHKPDAASLRSGSRPIWFWLALTALFFTTAEWFLYQRRWID